ncbi:cytochrome b [Marinobacter mangrovi]|uniref:cytochrome b n=1 Tax=Marinobacter mangrovi TaxID=2803918 RepID=UPI001F178199|nr:cytochrome b/b6 domain-containing protein [Marinobacter mangrovi]
MNQAAFRATLRNQPAFNLNPNPYGCLIGYDTQLSKSGIGARRTTFPVAAGQRVISGKWLGVAANGHDQRVQAMRDNTERYGQVSRFLHWGMALLILWQFLSAIAHTLIKDTPLESFLWGTHKPMGLLLLVLVVIRALWALSNLANRPAAINKLAKLGHLGIYLLLLIIPSLALLRQYGSGKPFEPFGVPLFAGFEGEEINWMTAPANLLHSWLGWLLLLTIIGHIAFVIHHRRRADKTDVLPRMWG